MPLSHVWNFNSRWIFFESKNRQIKDVRSARYSVNPAACGSSNTLHSLNWAQITAKLIILIHTCKSQDYFGVVKHELCLCGCNDVMFEQNSLQQQHRRVLVELPFLVLVSGLRGSKGQTGGSGDVLTFSPQSGSMDPTHTEISDDIIRVIFWLGFCNDWMNDSEPALNLSSDYSSLFSYFAPAKKQEVTLEIDAAEAEASWLLASSLGRWLMTSSGLEDFKQLLHHAATLRVLNLQKQTFYRMCSQTLYIKYFKHFVSFL